MTAFAKTIPVLDTSKPSIKQKGYSIIELSIALAIISIILVTALAGVQRILRSNNVNEDLKNINLVASKLAVMLSSVPNTAGTTENMTVFEQPSCVDNYWRVSNYIPGDSFLSVDYLFISNKRYKTALNY